MIKTAEFFYHFCYFNYSFSPFKNKFFLEWERTFEKLFTEWEYWTKSYFIVTTFAIFDIIFIIKFEISVDTFSRKKVSFLLSIKISCTTVYYWTVYYYILTLYYTVNINGFILFTIVIYLNGCYFSKSDY